jgi:polysaccharide biosynthesis transport protein
MSEQKDQNANHSFAVVDTRAGEFFSTGTVAPWEQYVSVKPGDDIELLRLLRIVWNRKLLIMGFAMALAGVALFIAARQTPIYRSQTKVELLGMNGRAPNPNISPSDSMVPDPYVQTEIELLRSEALIRRVAAKLHIKPPEADLADHVKDALQSFLGGHQRKDATRSIIEHVLKNLRVEEIRQSNLLELSFDDADSQLAANFLRTLLEESEQLNWEERWKVNERLRTWLAQQVEVSRNRMELAERELQNYSRQSDLLYTSNNDTVAVTRLEGLQEELTKAQGERIQKESQYRIAQGANPDSLPELADSSILREYQSKLADLNRQYAELIATMTPQNSKVLRVKAQINDLTATVEQEKANLVKQIENEYRAAQHRENLLTSAGHTQAAVVGELSLKAIHYNTLKKDVETARALYDTVLHQANDAELRRATEISSIRASEIRVVDPAFVPSRPARPSKPLMAGIGFSSGLIFGLTFIFIQEQRNRTIQQPGHSPNLLNVTELGVIPSTKSPMTHLAYGAGRRGATHSQRLGRAFPFSRDAGRNSVAASGSVLADSFLGIANSILFKDHPEGAPRVLLFSSPHPGEGKTTTVCNLGIAFSQIGKRVLLIDADFRKPQLHRMFGLKNEEGVLNLLSAEEGSVDPKSRARKTAIDQLSVLVSGATTRLLPTLVHSERWGRLLTLLREDYDLILIDSAPFLLVPESRVLARSADALVLVFRAGSTRTEFAMAARRRATEDRIPLMGTILNGWRPEADNYIYYPRYNA